jgi:uncharacterized protein YbaP (TraB family)
MPQKLLLLLAALVGFFLSSNAVQADTSADAQQSTPVLQRGTLYRVQHQGHIAYLFGTIHVGRPNFFPLQGEAAQALNDADALVVEFNISNMPPLQSALQKYGMYQNNDAITKHLSAATTKQLQQALNQSGIQLDQIARMKPWLVANMLLTLDLEHNGYPASQGTEYFLISFAKDHNKPIKELETAEYQLSLFDHMKATEQEQYLRESLEDISEGKALKESREMIDAWGKADSSALKALWNEERHEHTLSARFMQHILLDKRNPEMAAKIVDLMQQDKTIFVGVGLLHLLGDQGIPKLLQQKGYEVKKLY